MSCSAGPLSSQVQTPLSSLFGPCAFFGCTISSAAIRDCSWQLRGTLRGALPDRFSLFSVILSEAFAGEIRADRDLSYRCPTSTLFQSVTRVQWITGLGGRPFLSVCRFAFRWRSVSCLSEEFRSIAFLKSRGPRLEFAGLWLFFVSFHVFFKFLKRCLMFSFLNTVQ